jgi:hypothetical protein
MIVHVEADRDVQQTEVRMVLAFWGDLKVEGKELRNHHTERRRREMLSRWRSKQLNPALAKSI